MGKSGAVWAVVNNAKRSPPGCLGCGKRIFFGERCPPCARETKAKAANRKRRKRR